jgi:chloramphenicol 3-O-phosphotransferase
MIVLVNGSFSVGKTSTARALAERLSRSILYSPEIWGGLVLAMPNWLHLENQNSGDYQDMPLWRNLMAFGLRACRSVYPNVIMPMAFTNRAYLAEIIGKAREIDPVVFHICLVAPLAIVEARLRRRGDAPKHLAWQLRRARDCCAAHESEEFAVRIDASARSPDALADEIMARLSSY